MPFHQYVDQIHSYIEVVRNESETVTNGSESGAVAAQFAAITTDSLESSVVEISKRTFFPYYFLYSNCRTFWCHSGNICNSGSKKAHYSIP